MTNAAGDGGPTVTPRNRPDPSIGRPTLPDWMRDPPPPRLTLGRRLTTALARQQGWMAIQRRWWAWQKRRRLHERFPVGLKVIAFFASWLVATALVLAAYGIFELI